MSFLDSALSSAVSRIRIESALTPALDVDQPFASGPPSLLVSLVRPTITVNPDTPTAVTLAPAGEAHGDYWILVAGALAVGLFVAVAALWNALKGR